MNVRSDNVSIESPSALSPAAAEKPALWEQFDPVALFEANITKMHHHQATSQWIRTWSFAFTGFFLGYAYLLKNSVFLLLIAFVLVELILMVILIKDVGWHKPFWRYRDRARACEAYFLGNINRETLRREYLGASEPSRTALLRDAFSPKKLLTVSTDFVESYLMVGLAVAFLARLLLALFPVIWKAILNGH